MQSKQRKLSKEQRKVINVGMKDSKFTMQIYEASNAKLSSYSKLEANNAKLSSKQHQVSNQATKSCQANNAC
jgi:hypothetical protein